MLALLGSLFGILTGAIPEIIRFFKDRQDKKHEIELYKLQMENTKLLGAQRLEEIRTEADIRESEAMYKYAEVKPIPIVGNVVIDFMVGFFNAIIYLLNGLVRPTIAFAFTGFYGMIKYGQYQTIMETTSTTDPLSPYYISKWSAFRECWTETDHAVFATIIGHYFGQRMMRWAVERYEKNHR